MVFVLGMNMTVVDYFGSRINENIFIYPNTYPLKFYL